MGKKEQPTGQKRDPQGGSAKAPDAANQKDMRSIKPVDLSLHGDAISHWQDEPRGNDKGKPAKKPKRQQATSSRSK